MRKRWRHRQARQVGIFPEQRRPQTKSLALRPRRRACAAACGAAAGCRRARSPAKQSCDSWSVHRPLCRVRRRAAGGASFAEIMSDTEGYLAFTNLAREATGHFLRLFLPFAERILDDYLGSDQQWLHEYIFLKGMGKSASTSSSLALSSGRDSKNDPELRISMKVRLLDACCTSLDSSSFQRLGTYTRAGSSACTVRTGSQTSWRPQLTAPGDSRISTWIVAGRFQRTQVYRHLCKFNSRDTFLYSVPSTAPCEWCTATGNLSIGNALQRQHHRCGPLPDDQLVVTGSMDSTVRLWTADKLECTHVFKGTRPTWVKSVCFTADSHRIVSAGMDCRVLVWDASPQSVVGCT